MAYADADYSFEGRPPVMLRRHGTVPLWRRVPENVTRALRICWYRRGSIPILNAPIPCPLPYGGWFLAGADDMGLLVLAQAFLQKPYEEGYGRFLSSYLKPGMVFFDVGANQGVFTILAAHQVGRAGAVIAFEPAPTERKKLRRNLRLNRYQQVRIEALALGDRDGWADFVLCLEHQGTCSSLRQPAEDVTVSREAITVPVAKLDSYVDKHAIKSIDFIKFDIEGGELDALRGATETLDTFAPLVGCEIVDLRTRSWGYRASAVYDFLAQRGYEWFEPTNDGVLLPAGGVREMWDANLIAVPPSRRASLNKYVLTPAAAV